MLIPISKLLNINSMLISVDAVVLESEKTVLSRFENKVKIDENGLTLKVYPDDSADNLLVKVFNDKVAFDQYKKYTFKGILKTKEFNGKIYQTLECKTFFPLK